MSKKDEAGMKIAKAIIANQFCLEASEDLRELPIYRQDLKYHANKVIEILDKRTREFDAAFNIAEDFVMYSQERFEAIVPLLAKLNFDELIYVSHFLELFNKDKDGTVKMLTEKIESYR